MEHSTFRGPTTLQIIYLRHPLAKRLQETTETSRVKSLRTLHNKVYLNVLEDILCELLLQLLVGVVDAKLLEAVVLESLEPENVLRSIVKSKKKKMNQSIK